MLESGHNRSHCHCWHHCRILHPNTDWEKLLTAAKGKQVEVSVLTEEKGKWNAFLPFHIRVSEDPIDPYIAYRLIDPGYQTPAATSPNPNLVSLE